METSGGIGSVGLYDLKLSAGIVEGTVGLKLDLADALQKYADGVSNTLEKEIISFAAKVIKGMV